MGGRESGREREREREREWQREQFLTKFFANQSMTMVQQSDAYSLI